MKWIISFILIVSSIVLTLFITWLDDEGSILKHNHALMKIELSQSLLLKNLDKKTELLLKDNNFKSLSKSQARGKVLNFFDSYKSMFSLEIVKYFQSRNNMLFVTLKAEIKSQSLMKQFLNSMQKNVLLNILKINKVGSHYYVTFEALYPYSEYQ
jgi:hypothetical protein